MYVLSERLRRSVGGVLVLFFALCSLPVVASSATDAEYTLGAGDKIRIQVFGEDDLSLEVQLSDKGSFSYPFLGEVVAKGRTLGQLERYLTEELNRDYLVNPRVTVSIEAYRSFFVNGEVAKPGSYPFQPGLTLRKAIALAGGFTDRASRSKIYVIHDFAPDKEPQRIDLNNPIFPGDIVTVEDSFF